MLTISLHESLDDQEIIRRVTYGETALFELLIRRNNPYLYRIGRSFGYNHHDVQDLMQDTLIESYQHLGQLEDKKLFKYWVAKIMVNKCNKKGRTQTFTKNVSTDILNLNDIPMFSAHSGCDPIPAERKELCALIEKTLLRIPLEYRLVFTMREINGFNVEETAKALSLTNINVRVRLNRAKALLRKNLEEFYSPDELFSFNLFYCDQIVSNVMSHIVSG